jgi:RNA polymerase sigma factor (sigma-70 family)
MMNNDMELVRQYARNKSEEAFAALTARHVNLVYSIALRHVGNTHMAEEITQAVFVILARKAGSLSEKTLVAGWLCRTARFIATKALTAERRRQNREQEAFMQSLESEPNAWTQIEPLLEGAMAQLEEKDHDALVLRFFESRSFKEVSAAMGTSEAGAKMRVSRALEKLRSIFTKRGVTLSAAVIGGALCAHSVQAAPIGLEASAVAAALTGTTQTASTLALVKTTLKIMTWTKIKIAAAVAAITLLAGGTAVLVTHADKQPLQKIKASQDLPFTFAGYATPEAAVESLLWLAGRGDFEKFEANMTPAEMRRFKDKMQGVAPDEMRRRSIAMATAMIGYKIAQKEIISSDEVHLRLQAPPSPDGLRSGEVVIVMKKMGKEWRHGGEAN